MNNFKNAGLKNTIQFLTAGVVFIFFLLNTQCLFSQIKKIGDPLINNYQKDAYKADRQTWSITQQSNGMLYLANNSGVLQFDGTFWKLYHIPNNSIVRSVAVDKNDRVYAGAFDEFGYLQANEFGDLHYISLTDKLPEQIKNFGEIWKIYPTTHGVYFQSYSALFLFQNGHLEVLQQNQDFGFAFFVKDTLFVRDRKTGNLVGFFGKKRIEKEIKNWPEQQTLWGMFDYDNEKDLIVTERGLYFLKGKNIERWDIPLNKVLKKNRVFCAARIGKGAFAFGTVLNGLFVTDNQGNILQHINRKKNLQNNTVLSVFYDRNHKLWLGLDNGISEIDINSPFTQFRQGIKVNGTGYSAKIHQENIYLATNQGVLYTQWQPKLNEFQFLDKLKGQAWNLSIIDSTLFCGHNEGAFIIKDDKVKKISGYDNRIISGTYKGFVIFDKNATNEWHFFKSVDNFNESTRFFEFDTDGSIWVSHGYKGVYHLKPNIDYTKITDIDFYDKKKGLPGNFANTVFKLNNRIAVSTLKGIYTYDASKDKFVSSNYFNRFFKNLNAFHPKKDKKGNIWFVHDNKISILEKQADSTYMVKTNIFNRFANTLVKGFANYYLHDAKNVIIGTEIGFLHYNPRIKVKHNQALNVFIRSAILRNHSDTLKYDLSQLSTKKVFKTKYKGNNIKFIFSSPFFIRPDKIKFKYKLDNFEEKWSEWTTNNQKEYTNLEPGTYTFHIKAKNVYGKTSPETNLTFVVLPPWYRTVYAFIIYLIIGIAAVFWASFYIFKRIEKEKRALKDKQERELEKREKIHQEKTLHAERKIVKLKNEKLQAEIQRKNVEFDLKKKELASVALQITHKNEILSQVKDLLSDISNKVNNDAQKHIKILLKSIDEETKIDEDWEQFKKHFDEVHGDFFKRLRENYPQLTPKDLKLCAYLRINLSTKEIAPLMNISVRGVEISRYRLRKKLNLESNQNLFDFMMNV